MTPTNFCVKKIRVSKILFCQRPEYIEAHPDNDEALTTRGMQYWSMGDRAKAINDYLAAIRLNPDSKAKMALKATNQILDYYNKDLYNP